MEYTSLRQPIYNHNRYLIGVRLNREFALQCESIPVNNASTKRCQDFAWSVVKPKTWQRDHIPGNLFWWDRGTMLPAMFQHYGDHGKWLDLVKQSIDYGNEDESAVMYLFHHATDYLDEVANQWLLALFDRWVKCMQAEISLHKEPG